MISRQDLEAQSRNSSDRPPIELRTVSVHIAATGTVSPLRQERDRVDHELARMLWHRLYGDLHGRIPAIISALKHAEFRDDQDRALALLDELERLTSFESFMTRK